MADQPIQSFGNDIHVHHDPDDLWGDSRMVVNIGPTHPAMHGALRMVAKMNGETIESSYCEFGYTHRAKEKLGENRTYHQLHRLYGSPELLFGAPQQRTRLRDVGREADGRRGS